MYVRVHLDALWGKVGGDFLRQQVRLHPSQQSQVQDSSQPTAGRALLSPKTPENELGGRGAAVTAAGSALDGLVLGLQRRSQPDGALPSVQRARRQEEEGALGL